MVHLAIDGMWQVFKLQKSTPRNDFCRIAAKNGILLRLINTLYSLNEATRLASTNVGSGAPLDGSAQRTRSGPLDSSHPIFTQSEAPLSTSDPDILKARHGLIDHSLSPGTQEILHTLHTQRSESLQSDHRYSVTDSDRPQSSNTVLETSAALEKAANVGIKEPSGTASRESLDRWKSDQRGEIDFRQQRVTNSNTRISTDRPPKLIESALNGYPATATTQPEQVRPLLSLLDKEPPSRHFSGQLEYVRHISGLERHESILPLLHASEKKTNGELDFLMAEFAGIFLSLFQFVVREINFCVFHVMIVKTRISNFMN